MKTIPQKIMAYAAQQPEGTLLTPSVLGQLGARAAIDQALSRLSKRGEIIRAGRGIYLLPVKSRFGTRAPEPSKVVEAFAEQSGETVVPNEAAAANALGLTTQVPVRQSYLTSGQSRRLKLGGQVLELRHAPRWMLALANRPSGQAFRALVWAGERNAHAVAGQLKKQLPQSQLSELSKVSTRYMPSWVANELTAMSAHG